MITKHSEIAGYLRERIADGTYEVGSKIPSIPDLMDEFDVARDTVRDAISRLAHEGLVTPKRGVGTIVRDHSPVALAAQPGHNAVPWHLQAGDVSTDVVTEVGWVRADRDVAAALSIPSGSEVVRRLREQSKGLHVAQIHEQWIPDHVVTAVADRTGVDLSTAEETNPGGRNLFELLWASDLVPSQVTETVWARMPAPDEAEQLQLPIGVPVLITRRITVDSDRQPVETSAFTGAGDRMTQSYTVDL